MYKVSVLVITYNHADYIKQTLDGILAQETDFDFEIVVGDDASTDGTKEILQEYDKKYPGRFNMILNEKNLGPAIYPGKNNFVATLLACKGKYIASCDGDDYWSDKTKLQLQADIMDNNQDVGICYHQVSEINDSNEEILISNEGDKEFSTFEDIFNGWSMRTASIMHRRELIVPIPPSLFKANAGDYIMQLWALRNGLKAYFIPKVMAVYRRHDRGVTKLITKDYCAYLRNNIYLYKSLKETFGPDHKVKFTNKIMEFRNLLYYELIYNIKNKKTKDYLEILKLSVLLGKLNLSTIKSALKIN